jgi:hypothetical protein
VNRYYDIPVCVTNQDLRRGILSTVTGCAYFTAFLRSIVFVCEAAFGHSFDFERVRLRTINGADNLVIRLSSNPLSPDVDPDELAVPAELVPGD